MCFPTHTHATGRCDDMKQLRLAAEHIVVRNTTWVAVQTICCGTCDGTAEAIKHEAPWTDGKVWQGLLLQQSGSWQILSPGHASMTDLIRNILNPTASHLVLA